MFIAYAADTTLDVSYSSGCRVVSRCTPDPSELQLEFAADHDTPVEKCFRQKCLPSTSPTSYHTVQLESRHGFATAREYVPSSHPLTQSLHAAGDVLPAREYGEGALQVVHLTDP